MYRFSIGVATPQTPERQEDCCRFEASLVYSRFWANNIYLVRLKHRAALCIVEKDFLERRCTHTNTPQNSPQAVIST